MIPAIFFIIGAGWAIVISEMFFNDANIIEDDESKQYYLDIENPFYAK